MKFTDYNNISAHRERDLNLFICCIGSFLAVCPLLNFLRRLYQPAWPYDFYNIFENQELLNAPWCNVMFYYCGVFLWLLLVLYAGALNKKPAALWGATKRFFRQNPALLFWIAIALWFTVSTAVNGFSSLDVFGDAKSRTGLITRVCYLCFFLSALFFNGKHCVRIYLSVCAFAGAAVGTLMLVDYYFLGMEWDTVNGGMFFYNRNDLSCWLMLFTLCAAGALVLHRRLWVKVPAGCAYCLCLAGLVLGDTAGYMAALVIALVFGVLVLLLTKRKRRVSFGALLALSAAVFCGLMFVSPLKGENTVRTNLAESRDALGEGLSSLSDLEEADDSVGSGRYGLWRCALKYISQHPLFGVGESKSAQLLYSEAGNSTVHNAYLEYAMVYGIPALVFYVGFVLCVFIRGARHRRQLTDVNILGLVCALGYFAGIFFGYDIFYTTPFAMLFLGLGYWRRPTPDREAVQPAAPPPQEMQPQGIGAGEFSGCIPGGNCV